MLRSSLVVTALCLVCLNQVYTKRLLGVSWSNCGSATDPVQLVSLSISPDSVHLPGKISLSAEVHFNLEVAAPVKTELELKKKTFFGWVPIPCVDDIGSCNYGDVCALSPYQSSCPAVFQTLGVPCHCPISQGTYKVDNFPLTIDVDLPKWLERGHYKGRVQLSESGEQLACYEFETKLN